MSIINDNRVNECLVCKFVCNRIVFLSYNYRTTGFLRVAVLQAKIFDDHYVLSRPDHPEVSKRDSVHLTNKLTDLDEVGNKN